MSLMQHMMNIAGFTPGKFGPAEIKVGFTVTKVEWHGCMATEREVIDTGEVVRHEMGSTGNMYHGVVVRYDERGERWEPLDHFRKVDGALEVWT